MNTSNSSAASLVEQTNVPPNNALATTLAEFEQKTALIAKEATDLMASPLVTEGYQLGGHPAELAYVHLNTMAQSRLKKHFPLADFSDPVMARLLAEAKMIVAQCMNLKYKCRAERKSYDHLKDCNYRVKKLVLDTYDSLNEQVKGLLK